MSVPIENLIRHRAPMRWISELTGCTENSATATACLREGDFAVADGKVLETALVECMAQTMGAALGQRSLVGGGKGRTVPDGMLVAVSNFNITSRPEAGKTLHIEIRERRRLGPMLMISGTITCDGQTVATGELSLYV